MVFIFGEINTPCTNQRGHLRSPVHTARLHDALQPLVVFDLFGLQAQMRINLRGDTLRVRFPTQTVQRQTRALAHPAPEVDGRRAQVDVKVDLLLASRLAVSQTGVLFGVSDAQFELVAQPIVGDDLVGGLLGVARGQKHVVAGRSASKHDHAQLPPQVGTLGHGREDLDVRLVRQYADQVHRTRQMLRMARRAHLVEPKLIAVLSPTTSTCRLRASKPRSQFGVRAQPCDQMAALRLQTIEDLAPCVVAIAPQCVTVGAPGWRRRRRSTSTACSR